MKIAGVKFSPKQEEWLRSELKTRLGDYLCEKRLLYPDLRWKGFTYPKASEAARAALEIAVSIKAGRRVRISDRTWKRIEPRFHCIILETMQKINSLF